MEPPQTPVRQRGCPDGGGECRLDATATPEAPVVQVDQTGPDGIERLDVGVDRVASERTGTPSVNVHSPTSPVSERDPVSPDTTILSALIET